jgi:RNA polymerase sigma factor (TIGR02999 family)
MKSPREQFFHFLKTFRMIQCLSGVCALTLSASLDLSRCFIASPEPEEITVLLQQWSAGNREAFSSLMPAVYNELRSLAGSRLRQEAPGHTLSPTALVHEVYLRLVDQSKVDWKHRAHFFGVSARLIRQILVDHARARNAAKRGGAQRPLSFDDALEVPALADQHILDLEDALNALHEIDELQARIVELRYFSGLSIEETAHCLNLEIYEVKREWSMARAWLYRFLEGK